MVPLLYKEIRKDQCKGCRRESLMFGEGSVAPHGIVIWAVASNPRAHQGFLQTWSPNLVARSHRWTRKPDSATTPPASHEAPRFGQHSVHSRRDQRYRCSTCGRTFAATRDTPFYRLERHVDLVTLVITLLCDGCPVQAIVAAFGLDERTVGDWRDRAGRHAQQVP